MSRFDDRHRKEILRNLFDDLEVGLAHVTPSGQIIYSNPKFAVTLGQVPYRKLFGLNLRDFVAPHSWESLDRALRQASQESVIGEIKLNTVHDRTQIIRFSLSPARVMDQTVIRIVADEVTELVEINSQLRDTEASLRALSGRILQLQDQERRKLARDLHDTTGQELAVLVMSLRQLANSVNRPGVDLHKPLLDAADLAQKVNDDIRTLSYVLHPPLLDQLGLGSALKWYVEGFSKRSNIQVKLVIPADLRRFSLEKETTLFRVVQEGLTNVLRHAQTDKAEIVVNASGEDLEVTIKDEGKGLSPDDIQRLTSRTEGAGKSIGVGIAGLRERLRQLGGKLEITSAQRGTRLTAIVPVDDSQAQRISPLRENAEEHAVAPSAQFSANGRKRILIVDDHDVMRRGLRALIESCSGLEVCGEAGNGAEAVQKARELCPDLIVLDLNMPGSGGLSAANELQKSKSQARILVFTTHLFPGMERMLRSAGCKGFVSKLHAERDLLRGIRTVLEGGEFYSSAAPKAVRARTA